MAYKREQITYHFNPSAKVAMIMVLDQFGEDLTTIHEIKEMLKVSGSVVLDTHYAVVLARIIAPHYPQYAEKLMMPIETYPALTPDKYSGVFFELINRIGG